MDVCLPVTGPRVCPGMGLAYLESTMATVALISHFDFALACPMDEIQRVMMFTVKANKMPITLTKRR